MIYRVYPLDPVKKKLMTVSRAADFYELLREAEATGKQWTLQDAYEACCQDRLDSDVDIELDILDEILLDACDKIEEIVAEAFDLLIEKGVIVLLHEQSWYTDTTAAQALFGLMDSLRSQMVSRPWAYPHQKKDVLTREQVLKTVLLAHAAKLYQILAETEQKNDKCAVQLPSLNDIFTKYERDENMDSGSGKKLCELLGEIGAVREMEARWRTDAAGELLLFKELRLALGTEAEAIF